MKDIIANFLMTVLLFPLSMGLVWLYMRIFGPFDRKMYWFVTLMFYAVTLFICWGVELGYLKVLAEMF